jgi:hypothetical protein
MLSLSLIAASRAEADRPEFFGVAHARALDVQDLQRMVDSGVRTDRFLLQWRRVSPTQGTFQWGPTDQIVGGLASHGIQPVPFVWGSPPWVRPGPSRPPVDGPFAESAWRNFLKAAVARYGPGGSYWANGYRQRYGASARPLPITAWQIWNEENSPSFWQPKPNPEQYVDVLRAAHDGIKAGDPSAQIIVGGLFRSPRIRSAIGLSRFL